MCIVIRRRSGSSRPVVKRYKRNRRLTTESAFSAHSPIITLVPLRSPCTIVATVLDGAFLRALWSRRNSPTPPTSSRAPSRKARLEQLTCTKDVRGDRWCWPPRASEEEKRHWGRFSPIITIALGQSSPRGAPRSDAGGAVAVRVFGRSCSPKCGCMNYLLAMCCRLVGSQSNSRPATYRWAILRCRAHPVGHRQVDSSLPGLYIAGRPIWTTTRRRSVVRARQRGLSC